MSGTGEDADDTVQVKRDLESGVRRMQGTPSFPSFPAIPMTARVALLLAAMALAACAEAPTSIDSPLPAPASVRSVGANGNISGEALIGLTNNNELVTFESGKSNQTTSVVRITGLVGGEMVVGIDFRPSDAGLNGMNDVG